MIRSNAFGYTLAWIYPNGRFFSDNFKERSILSKNWKHGLNPKKSWIQNRMYPSECWAGSYKSNL